MQYEIINLAIPGYNTVQELILLKEWGFTYRPDLIIVGFAPNDADLYNLESTGKKIRLGLCIDFSVCLGLLFND